MGVGAEQHLRGRLESRRKASSSLRRAGGDRGSTSPLRGKVCELGGLQEWLSRPSCQLRGQVSTGPLLEVI